MQLSVFSVMRNDMDLSRCDVAYRSRFFTRWGRRRATSLRQKMEWKRDNTAQTTKKQLLRSITCVAEERAGKTHKNLNGRPSIRLLLPM